MTDWRPIKCPYCGAWHKQPDAATAVRLCKEYCMLHRTKVATQPDLPDESREKA